MAESSESVLIRATSGPAKTSIAPSIVTEPGGAVSISNMAAAATMGMGPMEAVAVAPTASKSSGKRPRPTTPRGNNNINNNINADAAFLVQQNGGGESSSRRRILSDTERATRLRDPTTRTSELNDLLQISANPEINFAMSSDDILLALSEIVLKECFNWHESMHEDDDYMVFRATGSWECPPTIPTQRFAEHCQTFYNNSIHNNSNNINIYPLVTTVAIVLRNFSFTAANLRLLAYSPECLYLLTAFFYVGATDERYRRLGLRSSDTTTNNNMNTININMTNNPNVASSTSNNNNNNNFEIPLAALTTLLHMIAYIDVTGQQLVADRLFYKQQQDGPPMPNPVSSFGQTLSGSWTGLGACRLAKRLDIRDDVVEDLSTAQVLQIVTIQHMAAVYSLFPALAAILTDVHAARPVVVLALDVLQKWIDTARGGLVGQVPPEPPHDLRYGEPYDLPTLRALLVHMPDAVLERLTDLLYVPRLGNDSLEYVDPCFNMVTRVNTLRLLLNYDAVVDTDVRDRALDALVPLLELDSPRMATRLARIATNNKNNNHSANIRLYDALIPAITTNTGRTEAAAVAAQLLRELAQATPDNEPQSSSSSSGLEHYAQQRLVQIASRDPRVSQLVWKELYPVQQQQHLQADDDENDEENNHNDGDRNMDSAGEMSTSQHDGVAGNDMED